MAKRRRERGLFGQPISEADDQEIVKLVKLALRLGRRHLADYSHPKSPQKFTQPELFACLILKAHMGNAIQIRGIGLFFRLKVVMVDHEHSFRVREPSSFSGGAPRSAATPGYWRAGLRPEKQGGTAYLNGIPALGGRWLDEHPPRHADRSKPRSVARGEVTVGATGRAPNQSPSRPAPPPPSTAPGTSLGAVHFAPAHLAAHPPSRRSQANLARPAGFPQCPPCW
jgi:hypothetical protein